MSLKYKLENLDGLDEATAGLYEKQGNVYTLKVDGIDDGDVAGLKRKNDELMTEVKALRESNKAAEEERAKAEKEAKSAAAEKARKDGDLETIESQWREKYEKLEADLQTEREKSSSRELDRVASEIAGGLSEGENRGILQRFVRDRLRFDGDEVKVTDDSGNLTISTLADLTEEFRASPKFAALVIGSKGKGGGAGPQDDKPGGGAAKTITRSQFDEMTHSERSEFSKGGGKVVSD
jgi:outer membrane murein-binding lipoprotein Lpp